MSAPSLGCLSCILYCIYVLYILIAKNKELNHLVASQKKKIMIYQQEIEKLKSDAIEEVESG